MALMIDTSRALLQPAELHRLVRAVEAAQHEDEDEWIEWKSCLDLRESGDTCQAGLPDRGDGHLPGGGSGAVR